MVLAAGCTSGDQAETIEAPPMNRFTPVVLGGGAGLLDEPMMLDVAEDGKVYIIERKGGVKMYNPSTTLIEDVGFLDVNTTYTDYNGDTREAEEGLVGLILDPDFEENGWVYMLYADPHTPKHNLSRFTIIDDSLDLQSEELLLDNHVQRNYCCHTGGGMDWDEDGNLYVAIGNNTRNTSGSQTDQRQGYEYRDDQRGAANSNDLRGSIIRIHPEDDGTYTIPEGNLFEPGTDAAREEIYAMGLRNPWRVSVDSETGWVYWSEVGPDNSEDLPVGPRGYDEFNQAREPGFFGWPYFVGPNDAFPIYDYRADTIGVSKDPQNPTNLSRNNTGLINLPPAQPPLIYYEDTQSETFPMLGTSSRSASGNRVYHQADYPNAEEPFPAYYENKFFMTDFSREWIYVVTLDEDGNYQSMEEFLPSYNPVAPLDMDFGPDGQLYVLEYGDSWFNYSPSTKLVRIEYISGNRPPEVVASASAKGGQVPFEVTLSSEETVDYDEDELSHQWDISDQDGSVVQSFSTSDTTITFETPGVYTATLTSTDPGGLSGSGSVKLVAGNALPEVSLDVNSSNQSFFFPGEMVTYSVSVSDSEDGSLGSGINPQDVAISINYASAEFNFEEVSREQTNMEEVSRHFMARYLIEGSDCFSCHQISATSAGPAYMEVAEKYSAGSEDTTLTYLADKIIRGGIGVWGDIRMPAHQGMSQSDARLIADYIMSLDDEEVSNPLPAQGSYTLNIPEGEDGRGGFVFRAAYQDQGASGAASLSNEAVSVLRSSRKGVAQSDTFGNVELDDDEIEPISGSYVGFESIDMSGVRQLALFAQVDSEDQTGGTVEIRLGSPDGELIGQGEATAPPEEEGEGGFGEPDPWTLIPITSQASGMQNVYIVFRNDQVGADEPLMDLSDIWFMNEQGPVELPSESDD